MNTPQESFHSEQEKWKCEIEEMFHELRCKEKVKIKLIFFIAMLICVNYSFLSEGYFLRP